MSGDVWNASIKVLVNRSNLERRISMECLKRLKNKDSEYYKDVARYTALLSEITDLINREFEKV